MTDWKLATGNFLFKYRSFTPLPIIFLVFLIFRPYNLGSYNWIVNLTGLFLSFFGEIIRVLAVGFSFEGTSGRENYLKAESLNTTGIYSILRNPLYIGNYFMFAGIVLVFCNPYAFLIFTLYLWGQYYFIIMVEENYLRNLYHESYNVYCKQVRRIIPTLGNYKKNQNSFNFKKVIFKEKDSVFNMSVVYLLILLYKEKILNNVITQPLLYIVPGSGLVVLYILVNIFKKKSILRSSK